MAGNAENSGLRIIGRCNVTASDVDAKCERSAYAVSIYIYFGYNVMTSQDMARSTEKAEWITFTVVREKCLRHLGSIM